MSGFDIIGGPLQGPELQRPRLLGEPGDARVQEGDGGSGTPGFAHTLADAVNRVDALSDEVTAKTEALAMGKPVELHDLMMAMGKSEAAFNLMLEVRNKIVDAWERLSRSVV